MRVKDFSLREQWKDAKKYLYETKKYIYFIIGLFIVSTIFGLVFRGELTFINKLLENLINRTEGLNGFEMVIFILQNNMLSALSSFFLGIFFGIFPIIGTVTNGVVLGYVLGRSYEVAGLWIWWRLLPHGIFELPAIFISLGMGVKLGFTVLSGKNFKKEFKRRFYNSMNIFLLIVIPLLIIAAIIEGILIAFIS